MTRDLSCPVCLMTFREGDYHALAAHVSQEADRSDGKHIMWLNRNVTKLRTDPSTLAELLKRYLEGGTTGAERIVR
ncbi:MAG TPA: C2H2 type zinc finger domain-containing protein [Dehalococcoidia bacterium]|nr:C2H2 type zinc finger domain-containing protein [Dehalococcoidia bacterium]